MEKIKLTQAVVVEGKYDKIKLSEFLDAFVVETNGFGIFKDKERLSFIKKLAAERGIILLTDSDHAGFMIRHYISSGIPKDRITNVYIPDVYGKEKRKSAPSKEGKLGVEGMTAETIIAALERATAELSSVTLLRYMTFILWVLTARLMRSRTDCCCKRSWICHRFCRHLHLFPA